jgi:hypothetical protein
MQRKEHIMSTTTEVYSSADDERKDEMKARVYEDNAGGINIYAFDDDGRQVWGAHYYMPEYDGTTAPERAAEDFAGITVQGIDPVEDGWGYGEADEMPLESSDMGTLIADSDWYNGSYEDMVLKSATGCAGRKFVDYFLGGEE